MKVTADHTVPELADSPRADIHLWLVFPDRIDVQFDPACRALLTERERERERCFYFAKDRRRYLLTRAFLRTILSRYAPVTPGAWTFADNPYGRPQIANVDVQHRQLSFNISHTDDLIVIAATRARAVGIDVENIRAREPPLDIADSFFAPVEVAALAAIDPQQRPQRFFEYWTLKESYIKARGMGLSIPLARFSFDFPGERSIRFSVDPQLSDPVPRWQFWLLRPTPQHLLAVCSERSGTYVPQLLAYNVTALAAAEWVAPTLLRIS